MGKKKRSQPPSSSTKNSSSPSPPVIADDENDLNDFDAFVPAHGWVLELEEAQDAVHDHGAASARQHLRIVRALHTLRQWEKCIQAVDACLQAISHQSSTSSSSIAAQVKKRAKAYKKDAQKELSFKSIVSEKQTKDLFRQLMKGDANIDRVCIPHMTFYNSNILQYAALNGDVRMVEALAAKGAALDFPFMEESEMAHLPRDPNNKTKGVIAPTTATALVMICAGLALYAATANIPAEFKEEEDTDQLNEVMDNQTTVAILLVRLGANIKARLDIPPKLGSQLELQIMQQAGMDGKTAHELAVLSQRQSLIQVMKEFESEEARIEKVECRCGSRLPWRMCHLGGVGQANHFFRCEKQIPNWHYSPLARCPCNHNSKPYYDCCWFQTTRPHYQSDTTGELMGSTKMPLNAGFSRAVMMNAVRRAMDTENNPEGYLFPQVANKSNKENSKMAADVIREDPAMMRAMLGMEGPQSQMLQWDMMVYAGCVERLDNFFHWKDTHWQIEKMELLLRVKEWNTALEQYCNDEGLQGEHRDRVLRQHTASPYAPCACPGCDFVETVVKELQRCARCRRVGYCSRSCQSKHWKKHKPCCVQL